MNCSECLYWLATMEPENEIKDEAHKVGYCHRYPPKTHYRQGAAIERQLPMGAGKTIDKIDPAVMQSLPRTMGSHFCGEHKTK